MSLAAGCVDVPCDYVVVSTHGEIDAFAGYLEPPGREWRVNWLVGMWNCMLEPAKGRKVLWTRWEAVGQRRGRVGRIAEGGKEFFVLVLDLAQFTLAADIPHGLELLKAVVGRYQADGEKCEAPLRQNAGRAF